MIVHQRGRQPDPEQSFTLLSPVASRRISIFPISGYTDELISLIRDALCQRLLE